MLFNSLAYAIFLPVVFIIYWALPHKFRWVLLWISSYYFYMSWNVKYVILILFTTAISFLSAILIEKQEKTLWKKRILAVCACACLGVLFVFKYFNFFSGAIISACNKMAIPLHPITLNLVLPVGISFYTFQTISYVIDVYRGDIKAEHHFGKYAAFISFFPQLVAGPIERTSNLLPQIKEERFFNYRQATYGMKLLTWGFFKKLVIADVVSPFVEAVYHHPQKYSGFALLLATLFFTVQIYCDFSGYSDIAIGSSKILGIDLMTNFKSPYFSKSVREFWSRWHISLSTWFRDYVYIPLGGNRVRKIRHYFNLMITFLLSGFWHGANWTFAAWGMIHGGAQILENIIFPKTKERSNKGIVRVLKTVIVFLFCSFAWIFFVSKSIADAGYVIAHLFSGAAYPIRYFQNGLSDIGIKPYVLIPWLVCVFVLAVYDYVSLKTDCIDCISKQKKRVRYTIYSVLVLAILMIRAGGEAEFVYFQF